jgi:hypothetical protein
MIGGIVAHEELDLIQHHHQLQAIPGALGSSGEVPGHLERGLRATQGVQSGEFQVAQIQVVISDQSLSAPSVLELHRVMTTATSEQPQNEPRSAIRSVVFEQGLQDLLAALYLAGLNQSFPEKSIQRIVEQRRSKASQDLNNQRVLEALRIPRTELKR